jgi:hypothetical protein
MKLTMLRIVGLSMVAALIVSCGAAKRGCPSNSSTMGAERILSGEKPEKTSKFKIKGMN